MKQFPGNRVREKMRQRQKEREKERQGETEKRGESNTQKEILPFLILRNYAMI